MNEIAIVTIKLPDGFFKTYDEIKFLELSEMPSVDILNKIVSDLETVPHATIQEAAKITKDLASCFPSYQKYDDALIEGLIEQFVKYPIPECKKAYKELRDGNKRMPVISEVRDKLIMVNAERLKPLNVAKMYKRRISRAKPQGIKATPDQIQQVKDRLK